MALELRLWRGGADARKKLGLPGGGPRFCITPLCIFDFEDESKRMRLKSVHPGVTVEQVLASTGFQPIVPAQVPTTPVPTEEQVALLRNRIDVEGDAAPAVRHGARMRKTRNG